MFEDVTEQVAHMIPENSLGLEYRVELSGADHLQLVVYRNGHFKTLTGLWKFSLFNELKTHSVQSLRPKHINSAIGRLQKEGTL